MSPKSMLKSLCSSAIVLKALKWPQNGLLCPGAGDGGLVSRVGEADRLGIARARRGLELALTATGVLADHAEPVVVVIVRLEARHLGLDRAVGGVGRLELLPRHDVLEAVVGGHQGANRELPRGTRPDHRRVVGHLAGGAPALEVLDAEGRGGHKGAGERDKPQPGDIPPSPSHEFDPNRTRKGGGVNEMMPAPVGRGAHGTGPSPE